MKIVKKDWGYETWIVNEKYCGKLLDCTNKWSSKGKYHYHKEKDETFFIIKGRLILDVEGIEYILLPGQSFRIKSNIKHRFKAVDKCKFIEFSTHHEDSDTYRTNKL